jgi:hypothetical protein
MALTLSSEAPWASVAWNVGVDGLNKRNRDHGRDDDARDGRITAEEVLPFE